MRKYFLIISSLLAISSCKKGDVNPKISSHFIKYYGEVGYNMAYDLHQTSDGGYIFVGETHITDFAQQLYLVKTDAYGNLSWKKTFGGSGNDVGKSIIIEEDGYVVGGSYEDSLMGKEIYLIKTDLNGEAIWTKIFGGVENQEANAIQKYIGNYIIAGSSTIANNNSFGGAAGVNPAGVKEMLLIDYNPGNEFKREVVGGGSGLDEITAIEINTLTNEIFAAGHVTSTNTLKGLDKINIFTGVFSTNLGNDKFSSWGSGFDDFANGIILNGDFMYTIGSVYNTSESNYDISIISTGINNLEALNSNFNLNFESTGNEFGRSIKSTSDGGFIIVGSTDGEGNGKKDILLIKTDASGNVAWYETYGGEDDEEGVDVVQTSDGGYAVIGYSVFGSDQEIMLLKVNAEGKIE